MSKKYSICIISGSARRSSVCTLVANSLNSEISAWANISDVVTCGHLPIFSEDLEGALKPSSISEIENLVRSCDGVIICSPEYNASIPGGLKNLLDWLSRPHGEGAFTNKSVEIIVHTLYDRGGYGAYSELFRVISHMRNRVNYSTRSRISGLRGSGATSVESIKERLCMIADNYLLFLKSEKEMERDYCKN